MTIPTYLAGTRFTAEMLNAIARMAFDVDTADQESLGHLRRLSDDALSNSAGNIKPQWQSFRDELKVTAGAGLSVAVAGGVTQDLTGTMIAVAPTTVNVPDNTTSHVFVSLTGVVSVASQTPPISSLLATVTTAGGVITQIVDKRVRGLQIRPLGVAIKLVGGLGEQGDYVLSGAATLSEGEYYFRDFTINATAVLTVPSGVYIYCSGNVRIDGTINISTAISGGVLGTVNATTAFIAGNGPGASNSGIGGKTYNYKVSPCGSGGATGYVSGSGFSASAGAGGNGGGFIFIEAVGNIVINGSINAKGGNATGGTVTTTSGNLYIAGNGGGSGGLIRLASLFSISFGAAAKLDVSGGNGSAPTNNATPGTTLVLGGGGGGGGVISLSAPLIAISSSNWNLAAGTAGANSGTGSSFSGGGGAGFGGTGGAAGVAGNVGILLSRAIRSYV